MRSLKEADADIRRTFAIFDAYLDGPADHPVGVAVSGGGDSVALLHALHLWGRRPLEVFCVDHGINADSGRWTASVATHAANLGAAFTALDWTGVKPKTGLSAAARAARHALLADAARQKGVRVLCLAHTEDDVIEARIMADEGSNVGTPAVWAPSPAWPEGRGVFLLRPFLSEKRAALRDFLTSRNISWIDDPANDDRKSHRARVRQDGPGPDADFKVPARALVASPAPDLSGLVLKGEDLGAIVFDATAFYALPKPLQRRYLAAAAVSAGGGNKLPRSDSVARLVDALPVGGAHTLCGARIQHTDDRIEIVREAGELDRRNVTPLQVGGDAEYMWDGRFALRSDHAGIVRASAGMRSGLSDADRAWLQTVPQALRTALPVIEIGNQKKLLPANASLTQWPYKGIFCLSWVMYRFMAACGAFGCESDLGAAIDRLTAEAVANQ